MIRLTSDKPWRAGPLSFGAGSCYLEDANAGTVLQRCGGMMARTMVEARLRWDATKDWNAKRVLLCRSGGFGDTLFLTPLLRAMKFKWPHVVLDVSIHEHYHDVLQLNPHVDTLLGYPLAMETVDAYDGLLWFEGLFEYDERAMTTHAVDLLAEFAGVDLARGRVLNYYVKPEAKARMLERCPHGNRPRIGIQMEASHPCRTYPRALLAQVIEALLLMDAEVFTFGLPDPSEGPEHPNWEVTQCWRPSPTFAETCALLESCDAVIAPDSALCHVAGALMIPTVALFGPYPWNLRTSYAESVFSIQGPMPCAPCFHRPVETPYPTNGPCSRTGRCEALAAITPKRIVDRVFEMVMGKRKIG